MTNLNIFLQKKLPGLARIDWVNVPVGTYVRYILAILSAINIILNAFNINPIQVDSTKLYDVVSAVLFVIILMINTYKDNPTSKEAIESNKLLKQLREEANKELDKKAEEKS